MKLRYTLRAAAELDEILTGIAEQSPQGARRVQTRIQVIINLLLQHPLAGQLTFLQEAPSKWLLWKKN